MDGHTFDYFFSRQVSTMIYCIDVDSMTFRLEHSAEFKIADFLPAQTGGEQFGDDMKMDLVDQLIAHSCSTFS